MSNSGYILTSIMIKQNKSSGYRCGLLGDTVDATSVIEPLLEMYGANVEITGCQNQVFLIYLNMIKELRKYLN